jgi:hypothetical protein
MSASAKLLIFFLPRASSLALTLPSGHEELTKYEMAQVCVWTCLLRSHWQIMGEVVGRSTSHITGVKEAVPGAPRPYNSKLDCTDLEVSA